MMIILDTKNHIFDVLTSILLFNPTCQTKIIKNKLIFNSKLLPITPKFHPSIKD